MTLALARIEEVGKPENGGDVMFNPVSLKVNVVNKAQSDEAGGGGKANPKQSPQPSTAKLEFELVFDTTEDGVDVRERSAPITRLGTSPKSDKVEPPKNLLFTWGRFHFSGIMESVTSTFDFWSDDGVPLRATVQITLASLNGRGSWRDTEKDGVKIAFGSAPPNGALATVIAQLCGSIDAQRRVAADNGMESMRMGNGSGGGDQAIAVAGAGVQLGAAAGFSAGAGAGIGMGGGIGASAGASAGIGFGIGATASAGASASIGGGAGLSAGAAFAAGTGAGIGFGAGSSAGGFAGASAGPFSGGNSGAYAGASFGSGASAGVSAGGGAFAGLGMSKQAVLGGQLDPSRLLGGASVTTIGSGAQFDVTGRLISGGSTGVSVSSSGVRIW